MVYINLVNTNEDQKSYIEKQFSHFDVQFEILNDVNESLPVCENPSNYALSLLKHIVEKHKIKNKSILIHNSLYLTKLNKGEFPGVLSDYLIDSLTPELFCEKFQGEACIFLSHVVLFDGKRLHFSFHQKEGTIISPNLLLKEENRSPFATENVITPESNSPLTRSLNNIVKCIQYTHYPASMVKFITYDYSIIYRDPYIFKVFVEYFAESLEKVNPLHILSASKRSNAFTSAIALESGIPFVLYDEGEFCDKQFIAEHSEDPAIVFAISSDEIHNIAYEFKNLNIACAFVLERNHDIEVGLEVFEPNDKKIHIFSLQDIIS